MLQDLSGMSTSDESARRIELSFDIQTRSDEDGELVEREYTFSYATEWDRWVFCEFMEKRTPDTTLMTNRNWRKSQHIYWDDVADTPSINVPPEVTNKLKEATTADSVVIQHP